MEYTFLPAVLAGGLLAYHIWRAGEAFVRLSGAGRRSELLGATVAREELLRTKRRLLEALREVEFDRQAGKLDEPDSHTLRRELEPRVMAVMKQIDVMDKVDERGVAIEAELGQRLRGGVAGPAPSSQAAAPSPGPVSAKGDCSKCGRAYQPGDRFCQGCGASTAAHCKPCGLTLEPDSRFCQRCGGSVA